VDGAQARWSGAREMARAVRLEADSNLRNAQTDLDARREEYRLTQSAESKASEAFKLAKKRYAEGILSLFDHSRSIQNWVEIRQQLVEAQRSVADAQAQLLFERGAL
jgi:outer membrane protein TolC